MSKRFIQLLFLGMIVLLSAQLIPEAPFTLPKHFPKPAYPFSRNKLSADKILLGRVLFYDPILSANNTISCATCHSPYNAFAHTDHSLSHGIYDSIGTRNAPALMNLAWQKLMMWDGAINHLDVQALAPISHPKEMGENINHVIGKLQTSTIYPNLFAKAYGNKNITGEKILKALAQFQLSLISCNAKYDSVMRLEATFTAQEQKGYVLFKQHCASCHQEPLFSSYEFANNGLPIDTTLNDIGRMGVTLQPSDRFKFKIPSLRNVEYSYPYMHDGRFKKLGEVLNHYTKGIQQSPTLAEELRKPISLSPNEKVELTSFLLTLSDKHFVFNKEYAYPKNILLP